MVAAEASGPRSRSAAACAAAAALAWVLAADAGRAQQVNGYVEIVSSTADNTFTAPAGPRAESRRFALLQRYSLNATWSLFPNLQLTAGGLFERNDSDDRGEGAQPDVTLEKLRPYLNLVYQTPLYFADLGFYRLEDRLDSAGVSGGDVRESTNLTLGWRPEELPWWTARVLRTDSYDEAREIRDTTDTLIDLTSEYSPADPLRFYYRGGIQEQEDRLERSRIRFTTQNGRINYGDAWWNRRVQLSAEYIVNYQKREVLEAGGGEIVERQLAVAGLSGLSLFPVEVELAPNPALIDGDRTASAGVNLGLPPAGGDERPRNLGLDFGVPTPIDSLEVWVDRDLPPEIPPAFRWEIYTSTDNRIWELATSVAQAPFGPIDRRFDIRFAELTARYVKVVVRPLDRSTPRSEEFPLLLVTELEAFRREPVRDAFREPSLTTHRYTSSLRTQLLANRSFYHDLSYFGIDAENRPSTYSLSNALSYSQPLGARFRVSARAARDEGREADRDFVSYPYSAALRAAWLPTLRQSLVLSGTQTDFGDETADSRSLFLQTSAELYRGVTTELGIGLSTRTDPDGQRTDGSQITGSTTLVPHPKLSVNLLFQRRDSDRGAALGTTAATTDFTAYELAVNYRPFPALYLFGSRRSEEQPGRPDRILEAFTASWSPFPDGSLQLSFTYDETFRSELDSVSENASASARWNVTGRRYLQLSYFRSRFDSILEAREQESIQGSMRISF